MKRGKATFYWYDLETSGTNPARDRIMQFAGVRTNLELNEVESPYEALIPLPLEALPTPEACLTSGLTPQKVAESTQSEWQVVSQIEQRFSCPSTTVIGYNNIAFDDEFIRYAFYRNLHDPYAREHRGGNSRADLYPIVLLCGALRPKGLEWPSTEDGPSFKLEHLATANGVEQAQAHDALSDTRATIDVARLLRKAQPRLWNYALYKRDYDAQSLLQDRKPVLHASVIYGKSRWCVAPVLPIAEHPEYKGSVIACDLAGDIDLLKSATPQEIHAEMFRPREERTADWRRPPLVEIRFNRFPMIAPLGTLDNQAEVRIGISKAQAREATKLLQSIPDLAFRLTEVYRTKSELPPHQIAEEALYAGFFPDSDRTLCKQVNKTLSQDLDWVDMDFSDPRLTALAQRLKARERPDSLTHHELARHADFVKARLEGNDPPLVQHLEDLASKLKSANNERERAILNDLIEHDKDLLDLFRTP